MRDFMVNKVQIHEEANPLTTEKVWHLDGDKLPKGSLERAEQEAKDKTPEELIEEAGLTVADGDTVSALNGVL